MQRLLAVVANDPEVTREQRYAYALKTTAICYDAELYERCLDVAQTALQYSATQSDSAAVQRRMLRSYYELERWTDAIDLAEKLINGSEAENASVWQVYYISLAKDGRDDDAARARERFQELR
jgi:lipopolysaccharide biosynthesis regulator YciM